MSSVHAFFTEIHPFEGRDLKNLIFGKNCLMFWLKKKKQKLTKIVDQKAKTEDQKAGKIFLNMTSANLLCTSSTLGLHGKPGINHQQYSPCFHLKYPICVLHLSFASSEECTVSSDWYQNTVITQLGTHSYWIWRNPENEFFAFLTFKQRYSKN